MRPRWRAAMNICGVATCWWLPMGPVKQYTAEKVDVPIELTVHPGADGAFLLYEDDGASFDFRKGEWTGIQMAWHDARRTLSLRLAPGSKMIGPPRRIAAGILGSKSRREVVFSGRAVELKL